MNRKSFIKLLGLGSFGALLPLNLLGNTTTKSERSLAYERCCATAKQYNISYDYLQKLMDICFKYQKSGAIVGNYIKTLIIRVMRKDPYTVSGNDFRTRLSNFYFKNISWGYFGCEKAANDVIVGMGGLYNFGFTLKIISDKDFKSLILI